jgi:hypothetical protein
MLKNILKEKHTYLAGCQWLPAVILAAQEAEIRRIMVFRSQPKQVVQETPS